VRASKVEAGVSGWQDESRGEGESIESMEMGLGNEADVRAGQMVSVVSDDVERSKTVSGVSPGYFER
jgi:hypothetical protein